MIVPSNSLSIFSRQSGEQNPNDSRVEVPNTLLPIAELGTPHTFFPPSLTRTPNGSFLTSATIFKSNSAGVSSLDPCVLSPGVWRLKLAIGFSSNWSDAAGTFAAILLFNPVTSSVQQYLVLLPMTISNFALDVQRNLYLTEDCAIRVTVPGNGVAQVHSIGVGLSGERVL